MLMNVMAAAKQEHQQTADAIQYRPYTADERYLGDVQRLIENDLSERTSFAFWSISIDGVNF